MIYNYLYFDPGDASKKRNSGINRKKRSKNTDIVPQLNADDIISGIIFSEILGKPRAKKPWQTNR